ncbi:MAG: S8 family serine peptidase [bacterium]|nr:S8 family serine peptidase [bacterium]
MIVDRPSCCAREKLSGSIRALLLVAAGLLGSSLSAEEGTLGAPASMADKPHKAEFVPGELLVKFRPNVLNQAWIEGGDDEVAIGTGIINDPLLRWTIEEILGVASPAGRLKSGGWKLKRVFNRLRPMHKRSRARSGKEVEIPDFYNLMLLQVSTEADVPRLVRELSAVEGIVYAEPNYLLYPDAAPNDSRYDRQESLEGSLDRDIDAERAWNQTVGSNAIKVGVIDYGIDYDHPDLGGHFGSPGDKVRGGWDFFNNDSDPDDVHFDSWVSHSHGTKVAGVIGALRNNSIGVAGIAGGDGGANTGVQLFAFKTGGTADGLRASDTIDAIVEASLSPPSGYGCHVINLSFGTYDSSDSLRGAIGTAAANNVVVVAAKGNAGVTTKRYPADYDKWWVIAVGASNEDDTREQSEAWGSNYGNGIDVVAPGVTGMVQTTARVEILPYDSFQGTSAAAPHVSGIAALLLSVRPDLHHSDVEGIIKASAEKVRTDLYNYDSDGWHPEMGFGRVNAADALDMLSSPWTLTHASATGGTSSYAGSEYNLPVAPIWGYGNHVYGYVYRIRKTVNFSSTYSSKPYVWGRGANESLGWGRTSPVHSVDHCEVISSTSTGAVLETYVYRVYEYDYESGYTYGRGWHPTSRTNAKCAYTVLGTPGTPPVPPEPNACFTVSPTWGNAPLTVTVNASCSSDPDGTITNYSWNMGDGGTRSGQSVSYTYWEADTYNITLTVTDNDGLTDTDTETVLVACEGGDCPW